MTTRLNLTTTEGRIVINEDDITVIAQTKASPTIKTRIWLRGTEECFNICDDYDEVINMLANSVINKPGSD